MPALSSRLLVVPVMSISTLAILAWLNSGTLSLYAATLNNPLISHCGYLLNIDNSHFEASFHLLHGTPGEHSTLLIRRILYPLLAYIPMATFKWLGNPEWFIWGGFLTSLFIYAAMLYILWFWLQKHYGLPAAIVGLLLTVTYPGIYYWIGSPYAYNWIVPGSVFAFLLLEYTAQSHNYKRQLLAALVLGIIFLGYDLWVFFLPAALFMLILQKRFKLLIPYLLLAILPTALYSLFLTQVLDLSLRNSNSEVYLQTFWSYFNSTYYANYLSVLKLVPEVFWNNLSYSNFLILPALFVLVFVYQRLFASDSTAKLSTPELCVLIATLLLFLFINLAPQSDARWQMRGVWIARLYQPVFVVFVVYIARQATSLVLPFKFLLPPIALLNTLLILAPALNIHRADEVFYNFYRHGSIHSLEDNLSKWGRRPLGYCLKRKRVQKIRKQSL